MRNVFENLSDYREILGVEYEKVSTLIYKSIFSMLSHKEKRMHPFDLICLECSDIDGLNSVLISEDYYVLHDFLINKGKKVLIKGRLAQVEKRTLLSFFKKECIKNEESIFLILNVDIESRMIALSNTEDWDILLIRT